MLRVRKMYGGLLTERNMSIAHYKIVLKKGHIKQDSLTSTESHNCLPYIIYQPFSTSVQWHTSVP